MFEMPTPQQVGQKLADLRKDAGLSAVQLAEAIGEERCSPREILDYEKGYVLIPQTFIDHAAKPLGFANSLELLEALGYFA